MRRERDVGQKGSLAASSLQPDLNVMERGLEHGLSTKGTAEATQAAVYLAMVSLQEPVLINIKGVLNAGIQDALRGTIQRKQGAGGNSLGQPGRVGAPGTLPGCPNIEGLQALIGVMSNLGKQGGQTWAARYAPDGALEPSELLSER